MDYTFNYGFNLMGILFPIFTVIILGIFVVIFVKGIAQWNKNNHSPRLTVPAIVVAKRANVSHHHSDDHMTTTSTDYYVTFQFQSGDRTEFHVSGREYGLLVEGDQGMLSFQGTRYQGFTLGTETF